MTENTIPGGIRALATSLFLGATLAVAPLAMAQQDEENVDTVWTDDQGRPWMSDNGDCWRNPDMPNGTPMEACGDVMPMEEEPEPEMRTEMRTETTRLDASALFGFDEATLTAEGEDAIDALLANRWSDWVLLSVAVRGYTDRIGDEDYNQQLSEERAQAVADYLSEQEDMGDVRMSVRGLGEADPRVTCEDTGGRDALIECLAPNRRVEVDMQFEREYEVTTTE